MQISWRRFSPGSLFSNWPKLLSPIHLLKSSTIVANPKTNNIISSCLNDYCSAALTPIIMKCFQKLVRTHIISKFPAGLDPHRFAFRTNRPTKGPQRPTMPNALSHLEQMGNYVRLRFVDLSSAFNYIILNRLVTTGARPGPILFHLPLWIKDNLSDCSQRVKVELHISSALSP